MTRWPTDSVYKKVSVILFASVPGWNIRFAIIQETRVYMANIGVGNSQIFPSLGLISLRHYTFNMHLMEVTFSVCFDDSSERRMLRNFSC